jgi:Xaa-Pro dipeptidase
MGEVFDAHARVMDNSGMLEHRLNACGYSLGATFTPTWMDYPMFYKGNPEPIVPGMVLFLHMILMNSLEGTAMTLGQTIRIDEDGPVRLSRHDTRLITC